MEPGRLTDLSELLTRATALAADLDSVEDTTEIGERPSFLVAQPRNDPQPIIERLASAKSLTFETGNLRTGIRVVADRAPLREDARAAFARGSKKATSGIKSLIQPQRRAAQPAAKRAK